MPAGSRISYNMSAGTQKRAAALREQLEEQGHYVEDATSPLFEQRVLAHVKDAHLLEGPPDLRKAKQVAPPVPPRAEARQVTQKAADSAAASAPAAVAGPTAKPAGTSAPDASNDSLPFVSVEQSRMLKDLDEIMMEGFEVSTTQHTFACLLSACSPLTFDCLVTLLSGVLVVEPTCNMTCRAMQKAMHNAQ